MSSAEKKIALVLAVVLIALMAVYITWKPEEKYDLSQIPDVPQVSSENPPAGMELPEPTTAGPEDARVKIVGLVPIVNPCHAETVRVLKELQEAHPDDIHLTLVDFQSPASMEWKNELGVTCATVTINGESTFQLDDRSVVFQKQEGGSYQPADLKTVVEAELAKAGAG